HRRRGAVVSGTGLRTFVGSLRFTRVGTSAVGRSGATARLVRKASSLWASI
ncbi:hypothetical protein TorRG33x02_289210, partial [Trema orientale]